MKQYSAACADFICQTGYADIGEPTVSAAKKCVIDYLGCAIGGASTTAAAILNDYIYEVGNSGPATVVGSFAQRDVLNAAFFNAACGHILEMDDVHNTALMHPGVPVIPAALSLAEAYHCTGRDLLAAIVVGYEIEVRIGQAVSPTHYEIWHNTATCGTFGAAAAAAKLLNLDFAQTLSALGNAGTQAAGLWEFAEDGAMTKYLHCGKAAMNGMIAALLAKRGFTGASRILEGGRGFFAAFCREDDFDRHFQTFGETFAIGETVFKPYPSCRHTHASIDAALELRRRYHIDFRAVDKIRVETYDTALRIAGNSQFDSEAKAKFSNSYCVATALKLGHVGISDFSAAQREDTARSGLTERIELVATDAANRVFPEKYRSTLTIYADGQEYRTTVDYPKGDIRNPMTNAEMERKYFDQAGLRIDAATAKKLHDNCMNLEQFKDMADFFC